MFKLGTIVTSTIAQRQNKNALLLCLLILSQYIVPAQSLLQYVQPMAGTAPSTTSAALKHSEAGSEKNANTIPSVGLPFGMTQWTAQTRQSENKCVPPYFYRDTMLTGFRGNHWLSGSCTQDYGSFTIMPVIGSPLTTAQDYALVFRHENETSAPDYYKLVIPEKGLTAEITATLRCGIMRFTLQQEDSLYLLIIPNSDKGMGYVKIDSATGTIWGYNPAHRIYQGWGQPAGFNGWFYIQVEKTIGRSGVFNDSEIQNEAVVTTAKDGGAFIGFQLKKNEALVLRIGTSFSGMEQAKANLFAETKALSFNQLREKASQVRENALSQLTVSGAAENDKRVLYTAMYHAMQHPRLFSDADGTYPRFAGSYQLKKIKGDYYDDFSMWDIYRAQLPLLEILQPAKINAFIRSLILKGEEGRWLPIFPCWNNYTAAMIGDHAAAFIASAYAKGLHDFNVPAAYRLLHKNAFEIAPPADYANGLGRRGMAGYLQYGFIPMEDSVPLAFHKKEQVSRTLEYAYDDYAIGMMAKKLGKTTDYTALKKRALNYKNVFDTTVMMVRGRFTTGHWYTPFNADKRELYITEGTPRQYSFYVPQDIAGLTKLMGGENKLEAALDSLFAKNEYWHGNEPGHQIPFLYNYTAAPWKTQRVVNELRTTEYAAGPGGLSGNDDAGQMSAWYIFAAMGFYPVDPVLGQYQLCTPLFDTVTLHLHNRKTFTIICRRKTAADIFIASTRLNGKAYQYNFIRYADMMRGGTFVIEASATMGSWGSKKSNRPAPALK